MKAKQKEWAADWERFNEIADKWESMRNKYGDYKMAELLSKTPSWRAYDQRWPFDNMVNWQNVLDITDPLLQIQSDQASVLDEAAEKLDTEKLIANLTPRQKKIFDALYDGASSVEIEITQGYNTNNAVRWHKHQIKKKYEAIKADRYEKRFEFVCRECGNVFDGLVIDSACPLCGYGNCLFTKQYFKPIFDE